MPYQLLIIIVLIDSWVHWLSKDDMNSSVGVVSIMYQLLPLSAQSSRSELLERERAGKERAKERGRGGRERESMLTRKCHWFNAWHNYTYMHIMNIP